MRKKRRVWVNPFISIVFLLLFIFGCKKDEIKQEPVLSTSEVSETTHITAKSGGNITTDGGAAITARGVCWSTSITPTILDSKTTNGTGVGSFTSTLTDLFAGTTYYIRAYATNSVGTGYGNTVSFTTLEPLKPVLTTSVVTSITHMKAISGGNIVNDGGSPVTARGVCWSIGTTPTILDSKTTNGTGIGSFTSNLDNLLATTTYNVRAYATNIAGTSYGNTFTFSTSLVDIDGNNYHIINIGTQVWMVENLKVTKYSNGDVIGTSTPATLNIPVSSVSKYQWAYNGDESNVATYGRLYTWYTVTDARNLCPTGWHSPSSSEWTTLVNYLGGEYVAGGKLKDNITSYWEYPNTGATNISGFTALPGGDRDNSGLFSHIRLFGGWWSTSQNDTNYAWGWDMTYFDSYMSKMNRNKNFGFSVRCLKN